MNKNEIEIPIFNFVNVYAYGTVLKNKIKQKLNECTIVKTCSLCMDSTHTWIDCRFVKINYHGNVILP